MTTSQASTSFEKRWWSASLLVAGIDEAGRGALAGPVVAAAVVLDPTHVPPGLADSKVLSKGARETLAPYILESAIAVGIGVVDHTVIDRINILQATFDAMHASLHEVIVSGKIEVAHVLVDGNRFRKGLVPHTCIVHGDALCASIAAASIIAKTHRDALMRGSIHELFPQYGFDKHVGYGTVQHRLAIHTYGPSAVHRLTFLRKVLA